MADFQVIRAGGSRPIESSYEEAGVMFGTRIEKRRGWFSGGRPTFRFGNGDATRFKNLLDRTRWYASPPEPSLRVEDVLKGMGAGLIGGLMGTVVMTQFQVLGSKLMQEAQGSGSQETSGGNGRHEESFGEEEAESATEKAAVAVATRVLHTELTEKEKAVGSSAVHYGFGTTMGGIYGALAEAEPRVTAGAGTAFGTVLWFLADEVAVPAMHMSGPPTKMPLSSHLSALAVHLVYGATTEAVRRAVRAWW